MNAPPKFLTLDQVLALHKLFRPNEPAPFNAPAVSGNQPPLVRVG